MPVFSHGHEHQFLGGERTFWHTHVHDHPKTKVRTHSHSHRHIKQTEDKYLIEKNKETERQ